MEPRKLKTEEIKPGMDVWFELVGLGEGPGHVVSNPETGEIEIEVSGQSTNYPLSDYEHNSNVLIYEIQ